MAREFSLTVRFSGLLHYVENKDRTRDVLLCIVLPEAPHHQAEIRPMDGCRMMLGKRSRLREEFSGKRVVFDLAWAKPAGTYPFDFERQVMAGEPKGAVPLEAMIEDRADQNPAIVGTERLSEHHVRAQILVGRTAVFSRPQIESPPKLRFRDDKIVKMVPFITMQFDGLVSANVVLLPLEPESGELPKVISLEPAPAGSAGLMISHFCPPKKTVDWDDQDFKFHYTLLQSAGKEQSAISQNAFPVPQVVDFFDGISNLFAGKKPSSGKSALDNPLDYRRNGCNCAPARGLRRPFNLDQAFNRLPAGANEETRRLLLPDATSLTLLDGGSPTESNPGEGRPAPGRRDQKRLDRARPGR